MKSGRTCRPSAISAASDSPPARATMSFSSASSASGPARASFGEGRMQPHQMVDRRAERRLAAVDQPLARRQRAEMRPPDAVDESRLVGQRHAARRGAENEREAPARIGRRAARPRAQRAGGAGVGVDEPRADRRPGLSPIAAAASAVRPRAERRSRAATISAPRRAKPSRLEDAEADAVEEFARPALFMREIAELAGRRAERARQRPGRPKRQEVGQIEEMPGPGDRFGLACARARRASAHASRARSLPPI